MLSHNNSCFAYFVRGGSYKTWGEWIPVLWVLGTSIDSIFEVQYSVWWVCGIDCMLWLCESEYYQSWFGLDQWRFGRDQGQDEWGVWELISPYPITRMQYLIHTSTLGYQVWVWRDWWDCHRDEQYSWDLYESYCCYPYQSMIDPDQDEWDFLIWRSICSSPQLIDPSHNSTTLRD
jgi:hypothetical protein